MTLFNFQFPGSHKIFFCWDADVRPKSKIHPISVFKNFEFPAILDVRAGFIVFLGLPLALLFYARALIGRTDGA